MDKEQFLIVWEKYLKKEANELEISQMLSFISENKADEFLDSYADYIHPELLPQVPLQKADWAVIWSEIEAKRHATAPVKVMPYRRWMIAAAILIIAGTVYWLLHPVQKQSVYAPQIIAASPEITPGKFGAILELADGTTLVLDSLNNGKIADQGGAEIMLHNNALSYEHVLRNNFVDSSFKENTLHTPRGRQFRISLPDGSLVWLNAASSVRFPTSFVGATREVTISGEAYLEVITDAQKPFIVHTAAGSLKVLGTSFNVKSYAEDDEEQITLIEGKLAVNAGNKAIELKPGEYTSYNRLNTANKLSGPFSANDTKLAAIVAWKENMFVFKNTPIREILKEFERWYDMDVVYKSKLDDEAFTGKISRDLPLSKALKLLELTKTIEFKIVGRTLEVSI